MQEKAILIYFRDCPHVGNARDALQKIGIRFEEIIQDELNNDHPYRSYSSPSIILNDKIIYGSKTSENTSGCSVGNIEDVLIDYKKKIGI